VMSVGIGNIATIYSNANIDIQPNSISIPIFRCSKSHQSCMFCDEKDSCSAKVLSRIQRTMIFLKCGISVAPGSRCCTSHLCEDELTIKSFDHIHIRTILFKQKKFDFDDPSCFSDEGYQAIVGLSKEQFNHLVNTVSSMRNSHVRSVRIAVAVFLAKLRLGLSNRVLAVLFNLENKRVVSHINNQVRKALMKDFVPYHLGLKHITRETAIEEHQTTIAAILHTNKPDQLCVIADTTYLFIQKSRSYQVKQAISYIQEHLTPSSLYDDEPEFIVELSSNDDNIVRARFSSRHINKKTYVTIIQHDIKNIVQPITGWYCTCTSERRDVGCCVHVAALLWHLGVCRAEIDLNNHPLSTSNIYLEIIDSIQFYDVQTSDDEDVTTDDEI
ncbi:unnamed protein product, partial [Rotaria sordida]